MAQAASSSLAGFQPLIDCRLELLDRLLFGVVPRADRFEIVRRTEEQIDRMLAELNTPEPSREQLLGVLARLEPPEALLPESADRGAAVYPAGAPLVGLWGGIPALPRPTLKSAKVACGLGAASLLLLISAPFLYLGIAMFGSAMPNAEVLMYCILGAYLVALLGTSIAAFATAFIAMWKLRRRRGTHSGHLWATAGLFAALIPFGMASMAMLYVGLNFKEFM